MKQVIKVVKGIVAAAVGGAAHSVTLMVASPDSFNIHEGLPKLLTVAGLSACYSAALYITKSPYFSDKQQ